MVNFYGISIVTGFLVSLIPGPVIDYLGLRFILQIKKRQFFKRFSSGHRSLKTENDECKGRRLGIAIFAAVTSVIGFIFSILHAQRFDHDQIGITKSTHIKIKKQVFSTTFQDMGVLKPKMTNLKGEGWGSQFFRLQQAGL